MLGVVETNDFDEFEVTKVRCQCVYPLTHCQVNFIRFSGREKMKTVIKRQILNRPPLTYTYLPQRYQQYSLLNLYSVFFLLLVPYSENLLLVPCSENLLLDRVASNSKKAHIFQNIQLLDTDNNVFLVL